MSEETRDQLTDEELAAANAEPLPDREQMSVIHGPQTLPIPIVPDANDFTIEPVPADQM